MQDMKGATAVFFNELSLTKTRTCDSISKRGFVYVSVVCGKIPVFGLRDRIEDTSL